MTNVKVQQGDITKVSADALITAINSGGMWFGGIDGAIQRCSGQMFHSQAASARLNDGDTVFARATQQHRGAFRAVLFVVDDLRRPLSQIVEIALKAADQEGVANVTLPALRTGVMAGAYERTPQEAVAQIGIGVRNFVAGRPRSVRQITFVVYNDPSNERALRDTFA
jgi:O-acetyl-ADP-ribose deacetylase (regulator of RNase III)